jgi:glycosyltransferase involved in cell wall biosynthesis
VTGQVSVVIPVRNGERYVGQAIESALHQTRPPSEIIVVDNGSQDASRTVAERFGRPIVVVDEPIQGTARARNAGLRIARGEFIAFLDADDLWDREKLARQMQIFERDPEAGLLFTHIQDFVSPDVAAAESADWKVRPGAYAGLIPSTLLTRASTFISVGLLPEIPIGEFIAWYGLAQAAGVRTRIVPEVLVRRRVHLHNTTRFHGESLAGYVKAAKLVLDSKRARGRCKDA